MDRNVETALLSDQRTKRFLLADAVQSRSVPSFVLGVTFYKCTVMGEIHEVGLQMFNVRVTLDAE